MLVKNINVRDLEQEFDNCGRAGSFSRYGYQAIIDYFEELNEELDVVGLDSTFVEENAESIAGWLSDYEPYDEDSDEIDARDLVKFMQKRTYAVLLENGNIFYMNF